MVVLAVGVVERVLNFFCSYQGLSPDKVFSIFCQIVFERTKINKKRPGLVDLKSTLVRMEYDLELMAPS